MVDDDHEDIMLIRDALREVAPNIKFKSLNDGQELLEFLLNIIENGDHSVNTCPELILLDLNMPKKSGFEALEEIRSNPDLKGIPVIILSTSEIEQDIKRSFEAGANSFLSKPKDYDELLSQMKRTMEYWFGVSRLPSFNPAG